MDNLYLLLRNNKQSGPFSQDELLQLGLKPYDLIWVEGRSTGWRSPDEISGLKEHLPGAVQETKASTSPQAVTPRQEQKPVKKETKKTLEKHVYISLPANAKIGVAPATEEREPSFEERVAKMQQRIAAVSNKNPEDVETKYTRSLEDIKEEYSSWLDTQKKKKKFVLPVKNIMAAAAVLVVVVLGFFIANKMGSEPVVAGKQVAKQQVLPQPAPEKEETETEKNFTEGESEIAVNNTITSNKSDEDIAVNAPAENILEADERTVVNNISATPGIKDSEPEVIPAQPKKYEEKSSPATSSIPVAEPVAKKETKSVPLTDLIKVNGKLIENGKKQGVEGYELSIQNNSNQLLKVVAVDVYYYTNTGRIIYKETSYFSNVQPQSSKTIKAPSNRKASTVQHYLGLISSDQGLFFAKQ